MLDIPFTSCTVCWFNQCTSLLFDGGFMSFLEFSTEETPSKWFLDDQILGWFGAEAWSYAVGTGPTDCRKNPQLDFQNVATDCGHNLTILNIWWWSSWLLLRRGGCTQYLSTEEILQKGSAGGKCHRCGDAQTHWLLQILGIIMLHFAQFQAWAVSAKAVALTNKNMLSHYHMLQLPYARYLWIWASLGIFGHFWSLIAEMLWFSHVFSRS